jgi:hypothetical protein
MYMKLQQPRSRAIVWIHKIIELDHNPDATAHIIRLLCRAEPRYGALVHLKGTLVRGISIGQPAHAGPFLQAALVFCAHAPEQNLVKDLIFRTAHDMAALVNTGGVEHLDFFRRLARVLNDHWALDVHFMQQQMLECIEFWAPPLLFYWDPEVRDGAEALVREMFLGGQADGGSGSAAVTESAESAETADSAESVESVETAATLDTAAETTTDTTTMMLEAADAGLSSLGLEVSMRNAANTLGNTCLNKLSRDYLERGVQVERRMLESIDRVIKRCVAFYGGEDAEDYDARRESELPLYICVKFFFWPSVSCQGLGEKETGLADLYGGRPI